VPLIITETSNIPKTIRKIEHRWTTQRYNARKQISTHFPGWSHQISCSKAISLLNQKTTTVTKEFVIKIICKHGIPDTVLTNQSTNFLSEVFKNICKLLKIIKIQTVKVTGHWKDRTEFWRNICDIIFMKTKQIRTSGFR